ncbi:MAG: nicotinamide mononucleotide transporter [Lachnospira sp.]|nr:nicotinamide mononucleotide transporter [Lachnospira sp.]
MEKLKCFIKDELTGWKNWEKIWLILNVAIIAILSLVLGDDIRGIVAAVTGVMYVVLTGKGKISGYLFGLINGILYAMISYEAQYYGEVMLNVLYYIPMHFVGWVMWKKHIDDNTKEIVKERMPLKLEIILMVLSLLAIVVYGYVLKLLGGSLPYIDSVSTCLSVLAMILSVRRMIEQWVLWTIVNAVTVYMWVIDYMNGGSDVAMLLMWMVYLANGIIILIKWIKDMRKQ